MSLSGGFPDSASGGPADRLEGPGFDPRCIWVVIPAYNDDGEIRNVVDSVAAGGYTIVVVDDGSRRSIFDQLRGHPCMSAGT